MLQIRYVRIKYCDVIKGDAHSTGRVVLSLSLETCLPVTLLTVLAVSMAYGGRVQR